MTPFDTVCQLYKDHPQEEPFEYYLLWHLRNGFVFNTPEYFIAGRPVLVGSFNPGVLESVSNGDGWYIHVMAGNMSKAWDILPWPLPYLCWERLRGGKREFEVHDINDVKRLSHRVVKSHAQVTP